MLKHFILGPQNGQNGFWLGRMKNKQKFLFMFSFPLEQALKMFVFLYLPFLGQQSTFSESLRPVKKQNFKVKIWNWGPLTIWHTHNIPWVQYFFLITPPYNCTVIKPFHHGGGYIDTRERGKISDRQLLTPHLQQTKQTETPYLGWFYRNFLKINFVWFVL